MQTAKYEAQMGRNWSTYTRLRVGTWLLLIVIITALVWRRGTVAAALVMAAAAAVVVAVGHSWGRRKKMCEGKK
jgi:hypothetical protein